MECDLGDWSQPTERTKEEHEAEESALPCVSGESLICIIYGFFKPQSNRFKFATKQVRQILQSEWKAKDEPRFG